MRVAILEAIRNIETKHDCVVEEISIIPNGLPCLRYKVRHNDPEKTHPTYYQQPTGIEVLPYDLYQWVLQRFPDWGRLD